MLYMRASFPGLPHKALFAAPRFRGCLIRPHNKQNTIYVLAGPENTEFFSTDLLMGLLHITSVSSHCGMSRNERHTSTVVGLFLSSPATILCHQQAFRAVIYWDRYPRAARRWWRGEGGAGVWWGDLMRGTPFSELFVTLLVINQCNM
jgi:hypothetical protein